MRYQAALRPDALASLYTSTRSAAISQGLSAIAAPFRAGQRPGAARAFPGYFFFGGDFGAGAGAGASSFAAGAAGAREGVLPPAHPK